MESDGEEGAPPAKRHRQGDEDTSDEMEEATAAPEPVRQGPTVELRTDSDRPNALSAKVPLNQLKLSARAEEILRTTGWLPWCPADKQRGCPESNCIRAHVVNSARATVDATFALQSVHYTPCVIAPPKTAPVLSSSARANVKVPCPKGCAIVKAALGSGGRLTAVAALPFGVLVLNDQSRGNLHRDGCITWCRDDRELGSCSNGNSCPMAHVAGCDRRRAAEVLRMEQAQQSYDDAGIPVMPEDSDDDITDIRGYVISSAGSRGKGRKGGKGKGQGRGAPQPLSLPPSVELRLRSDGEGGLGTVVVQARDLVLSARAASHAAQTLSVSWCREDRSGQQCQLGDRQSCSFAHVAGDVKAKVAALFDDPSSKTHRPPKLSDHWTRPLA
eukprot:TRINITY_DN65502_c0_g1_i1.p1 TRINITY_DN65502_c0_g1~~TRINITY_DN65502_c0_g1_i1.p1  ORF type:complete len:416 (+),score=111.18 TRINITY_DN65502_c0_g1_i1:88-1248(+)